MKTAMQKHIDDLEQALQVYIPLKMEGVVSVLESSIASAKHYLEKEKEQICKAWEDGYYSNAENLQNENEKYYNDTY